MLPALLLLALPWLAPPMAAPRMALASLAPPALAITFSAGGIGEMRQMAGGDSVLDVGEIRAGSGRGHASAAVVRRMVRVRVDGNGAARFARLTAFLPTPEARVAVRVDGLLLSAMPQIISTAAPLGAAVNHVIEIQVPRSEPGGALFAEITWTAETD